MDITKPYKFTGFGDIHGPKPSNSIGSRWAFTGGSRPQGHLPRLISDGLGPLFLTIRDPRNIPLCAISSCALLVQMVWSERPDFRIRDPFLAVHKTFFDFCFGSPSPGGSRVQGPDCHCPKGIDGLGPSGPDPGWYILSFSFWP